LSLFIYLFIELKRGKDKNPFAIIIWVLLAGLLGLEMMGYIGDGNLNVL